MTEKEKSLIEVLVSEGRVEEALRYDRLIRKRERNKDAKND